MTICLQAKSIGEVSTEASQRLLEAGGARYIAIDTEQHRIEFKKDDARFASSLVIQTDEMFTAEQVAELATLSLKETAPQREAAIEMFIDFFDACSARSIIWMCPQSK